MKQNAGYYCKGNVMTPLNWFAGICETGFIYSASQNSSWQGIAFFITAVLFAVTYVAIYLYILKTDPNRLQSKSLICTNKKSFLKVILFLYRRVTKLSKYTLTPQLIRKDKSN